ncbi:hypothetical protein MKW92_041306 [Papaver armeniacum]|nr:hypothetical protein MKW92_041306 [Papaver armeniacum]
MASDGSSGDWEGKSGSQVGGGNGVGVDARERHKLSERERRKSMSGLFLSLHSLLPHSNTVRKEQSAILDEIIKYIPIAAARLRSLQNHTDNNSSDSSNRSSLTSSSSSSKLSSLISHSSLPSIQASDRDNNKKSATATNNTILLDYDIRVAPDASSSVAIRVRGDRVNVCLSKGTSRTLLLSAVLDELENHQLQLVRSTHCRDGSKVLHYSETKICDGLDKSPSILKSRLQELARELHKLRKSTSLKRTFHQIE